MQHVLEIVPEEIAVKLPYLQSRHRKIHYPPTLVSFQLAACVFHQAEHDAACTVLTHHGRGAGPVQQTS